MPSSISIGFSVITAGLLACIRRERGQQPTTSARLTAEQETELEMLLADLHLAGDKLIRALDAEAQCGREEVKREDGSGDRSLRSGFQGWLACRDKVQEAQRDYSRATTAFREFVERLTPNQRMAAAGRRTGPMTVRHA